MVFLDYEATANLNSRTFIARDITVIVSTMEPHEEHFRELLNRYKFIRGHDQNRFIDEDSEKMGLS